MPNKMIFDKSSQNNIIRVILTDQAPQLSEECEFTINVKTKSK